MMIWLFFNANLLPRTFHLTLPSTVSPAIVSIRDEMHAKCLQSKQQKIIYQLNRRTARLTNPKLNGCLPAVALCTIQYNISHHLIAFLFKGPALKFTIYETAELCGNVNLPALQGTDCVLTSVRHTGRYWRLQTFAGITTPLQKPPRSGFRVLQISSVTVDKRVAH